MNRKILLRLLTVTTVALLCAWVSPARGGEQDVLKPRVAADRLAAVRRIKNPIPADAASIAAGRAIFLGKGLCVNCHGESGKGNGPGAAAFDPGPRNFTDTAWQSARTDGELFTVITEGTQYGMIAFGNSLTAKEKWEVIDYLRTFGGGAVAQNTHSKNISK